MHFTTSTILFLSALFLTRAAERTAAESCTSASLLQVTSKGYIGKPSSDKKPKLHPEFHDGFNAFGEDSLGPSSIVTDPATVTVGKNFDIVVTATPDVEIDAGSVISLVFLSKGQLSDAETIDICSLDGVSCPLPAGSSVTLKLKPDFQAVDDLQVRLIALGSEGQPLGSYSFNITGTDAEASLLEKPSEKKKESHPEFHNGFNAFGEDSLGPSSIVTDPATVTVGKNFDIVVTATPDVEIVAGSVISLVFLSQGQLSDAETIDICSLDGVSCPLPAGNSVTLRLKPDFQAVDDLQVRLIALGSEGQPLGSYAFNITGTDDNEASLLEKPSTEKKKESHPEFHDGFNAFGEDSLGPSSIVTDPATVTVGKNFDIVVTATPDVEIDAGSVISLVFLNQGQLSDAETIDICSLDGVSCPLAAGSSVTLKLKPDFQAVNDLKVRLIALGSEGQPLGSYEFNVTGTDDSEASLLQKPSIVTHLGFNSYGPDSLAPSSIVTNPDTVSLGKTFDVVMTATPDVEIDAGAVFNLVFLQKGVLQSAQTIDICSLDGVNCPLPAGQSVTMALKPQFQAVDDLQVKIIALGSKGQPLGSYAFNVSNEASLLQKPSIVAHIGFNSYGPDSLSPSSIVTDPDAVPLGKTFDVVVTAAPDVEIDAGAVFNLVFLQNEVLQSAQTIDICSLDGVNCPLPAGQSVTLDLKPQFQAVDNLQVKIIGLGSEGQPLGSYAFNVTVSD